MFDPGVPEVTIDIDMKRYTKQGGWEVQKVRTVFSRRGGSFSCGTTTIYEVFYTVDNDRVKFENEDCLNPIPVIT
jgi:hypothetical protein